MTQGKNNTDLTELLLKCMAEPDPMLSMLEWLCAQLMEAEVSGLVGAEKNARNLSRSDYRCGYRPRRLDTRVGTMYLMVPKLRSQGYIPFFVTERKRCEAALIQVIQEALNLFRQPDSPNFPGCSFMRIFRSGEFAGLYAFAAMSHLRFSPGCLFRWILRQSLDGGAKYGYRSFARSSISTAFLLQHNRLWEFHSRWSLKKG